MSEANQIITTGSITHPSIGIIGFSVTARDRNTASLPHGVYIERRFRVVPRPLQTGEMVKIT